MNDPGKGNLTQAWELPEAVEQALNSHDPGVRHSVATSDLVVSVLEWGDVASKPVLLLHGGRASARAWWRVGPAVAAAGYRVLCPDLPGHGNTPSAPALAAFSDTAALIGNVMVGLGISEAPLDIVGTSWGAMIAANLGASLGAAGRPPEHIIVVEPPVVTPEILLTLRSQMSERPGGTLEETHSRVDSWHPDWLPEDRRVKAEALHALDIRMLEAVIAAAPAWDGAIGALRDAQTMGSEVWIVRGNPKLGGLTPDSYAEDARGTWTPERVISIDGSGHVPQRTHPRELAGVLLRALC